MQIFGLDCSEPTVQISASLRKTKSKNKHPTRKPKISAHTRHPTKQPTPKPSLVSNLSILATLNSVPREMGKLFAFYRTHLFTHMQRDRGPPGNR